MPRTLVRAQTAPPRSRRRGRWSTRPARTLHCRPPARSPRDGTVARSRRQRGAPHSLNSHPAPAQAISRAPAQTAEPPAARPAEPGSARGRRGARHAETLMPQLRGSRARGLRTTRGASGTSRKATRAASQKVCAAPSIRAGQQAKLLGMQHRELGGVAQALHGLADMRAWSPVPVGSAVRRVLLRARRRKTETDSGDLVRVLDVDLDQGCSLLPCSGDLGEVD
jgi:hypothetical protein